MKNNDKPKLVIDNNLGLEIKNLRKSFKSKPILRNINIKLNRGEAVAILGPNGAGKTTCFYTIAGLISADVGEIILDGEVVTNLPVYRRALMGLNYLPQEASIFKGLNVEKNINAILELSIKDKTKRRERLDTLLAEFSITHLKQTSALSLSGGERRRVEIARCLANNPKYILLDEPFAGVDPIAVEEIRVLVSHLKNKGIGVLITDHNVRETLKIVDKAYILHDGKVLMSGTPFEVIKDNTVKKIYLGENFISL